MFSSDITDLAQAVVAASRRSGLMVATAESCTGGLVVGALTAVAGSSDALDRGFVTYSNAAKAAMLGVAPDLIEAQGAVSEAVARAMAEGAAALSEAEVAVAVTGIAGPGGGTPDKPTGLVHFHLSAKDGVEEAHRQIWPADRRGNKLLSAEYALRMLLGYAGRGLGTGD